MSDAYIGGPETPALAMTSVSEPRLGRLRPIAPREVWANEARDFTPWLLKNSDVLSDLLGMDLILDVAEHPVGGFSLDLKGYNETSGEVVIVENQLEASDHTHLGQVITYAAGTDAATVIWIATSLRQEHRAAIDWLNQRTDEHTRVFGVAIKVVQIGDSEPAPAFELIASPNDWEKEVKRATTPTGGAVSAKAKAYRAFWDATLRRVRSEYPAWTRARTNGGTWLNMSTGTPHAVLAMAWTGGHLVCQLYFDSSDADLNAARFDAVEAQRATFETALGEPASWDPMHGLKGARITLTSPYSDVEAADLYQPMIDWLIHAQLRFREAIRAIGGVPRQLP